MTRTLDAQDVDDLAVGAWVLGTGGGGSPYLNHLNMQRIAADGMQFELIDPQELDDQARVAVVSTMGAPLVMQERLQDPRDVARAVEVMAEHTGSTFDAVMATEIGGSNAFQPLMASAHLGIPIVDADAMGRAYPEAQMTSFAIGGLQPWPLALVDPRGVEAIVTQVPTWKWMERASRALTIETGSMAATCKAPRSGAEVKRWGVANSMSFAIHLARKSEKPGSDMRIQLRRYVQQRKVKFFSQAKLSTWTVIRRVVFCAGSRRYRVWINIRVPR